MRKPVAYIKDREIAYMMAVKNEGATGWHTNLGLVPEEGDVPLYEGKEWVWLTGDEMHDIWNKYCDDRLRVPISDSEELFYAIEAKLKEKNHD